MQKESSNPRRVYFLYEDGISVWPLIHFLFTQYLTILILRCYHKPYFQFVFFLQSKYEVINIASSNKNKRLSKSFCGIHKTSSFQLIYKCCLYITQLASIYTYGIHILHSLIHFSFFILYAILISLEQLEAYYHPSL